MKASKLRQSILQAAVQGKLVPQDLHDEPASELLERIRAEKAKLIKEGKIKKEKPLPPIIEDEIPYDLPEGWVWCRLGEVTTILRGASPRPKGDPRYWADRRTPYHWIKISDVSKYTKYDVLHDTDEFLTEEGKDLSVFVDSNFIITAASGSIGKSALLGITGYIYDGLLGIRVIEDTLDKRYIISYIGSIVVHLVNESTGTSWKNIRTETLKTALFPIPPIKEQKRIVDKIDELMALCDELEAAENELETLETQLIEYLPKSILQMAVQGKLVPQHLHDEPAAELLERIRAEKARLIKEGKLKKEKPLPPITEDEIPYDLPEGWVWCRLGELLQFAENNNIHKTLPGDTLINYVDIDSIDNKNYCIKEAKVSPVNKLSSRARRVLEKDYIVYSLVRPYLNNIALIIENKENYIGSTGFAVFKPIYIEVNYLINYLLSPFVEMYFLSILSGFNSPSVSQTDFQKTLFPLPPLAEQRRIVEKTDKLLLLCKELRVAKSLHTSIDESNVVPFPQNAAPQEIDIAARGDAEGLPQEALDDLAELFGDGKND